MSKLVTNLVFITISLIYTSPVLALPSGAQEALVSQFQEVLSELEDTRKAFTEASKQTRPLTKRIKILIMKINLMIIFASPNKCKNGINSAISRLGKIILKLENKRCKINLMVNSTSRCVPGDIIDNFIPKMQELFQEVQSISLIDEGGNKIPDVCEKVQEQ